jgi:alpha-beta hydrolase superfamily lysophospholipase
MKSARRLFADWPLAVAILTLAAGVYAQDLNDKPTREEPVAQFTTVNGVRLHYLDWGGKGETLLFLTALGGTANDFQPLAVRFTDHFHVLGLTRRGQGQSAKPDAGYDTSQLVEDIRAFLDQRRLSVRPLSVILWPVTN